MTPSDIRAARRELGLSLWQLATLLGYTGNYEMRKQMMHHLETGELPLRGPQRRLLESYLSGWRPSDWEEIVSEGALRHRQEAESLRD
jgi:hypothetical protein